MTRLGGLLHKRCQIQLSYQTRSTYGLVDLAGLLTKYLRQNPRSSQIIRCRDRLLINFDDLTWLNLAGPEGLGLVETRNSKVWLSQA